MQDYLAKLDPRLFYAAVAGLTWLLIWLWRKYLPRAWEAATRRSPTLQQLPALVLAALMSAAPAIGRPALDVVQQVVFGLIIGALPAIGLHTAMKETPLIPYTGGKPAGPPPIPPDARK